MCVYAVCLCLAAQVYRVSPGRQAAGGASTEQDKARAAAGAVAGDKRSVTGEGVRWTDSAGFVLVGGLPASFCKLQGVDSCTVSTAACPPGRDFWCMRCWVMLAGLFDVVTIS